MYAGISVSVLQVPAGKEGEPGGLPNFLKEEFDEEKEEDDEEKEEDDEEKKENYEKEMEGKRRDEEDMQDILVVEEGRTVKFPFVPLPLVSFPCISCCKVLSAKKK